MSLASGLKRVLVSLLLEFARVYGLTLDLNRDSGDDLVKAGFRKVILRTHPDKPGGSEAKAGHHTRKSATRARHTHTPPTHGRAFAL